jgi:4-hydroxybenzoate polyprenyltransferase
MKKIKLFFSSLRPWHWVKNLFIFVGPFFALKLFNLYNIIILLSGFLCWCLITSATYLFNDTLDKKQDFLHPLKKNRPVASGALSVKFAYFLFFLLAFFSVLLAQGLSRIFSIFIITYLLLNMVYSLYLKHVFLLDVMCIATGFVLRVISGAALIKVGFSEWIVMCAFLLSLFLGFGKRQEEISILKAQAIYHRKVLNDYDRSFLQHIPYVLASSTILCYMLYTVSNEAVRKFGTKDLIYTTPFVIYGMFRYIYIAFEKKHGADPTQVLFGDLPTLLNLILWIIAAGLIIYF